VSHSIQFVVIIEHAVFGELQVEDDSIQVLGHCANTSSVRQFDHMLSSFHFSVEICASLTARKNETANGA
jgi:hypothetical protein